MHDGPERFQGRAAAGCRFGARYASEYQFELRYLYTKLYDGDTTPPDGPWMDWKWVEGVDDGWQEALYLHIDAFRSWLSVEGATFVEDPAHPESWLRDVRLQYWDLTTRTWRDGPLMLSDYPVHTRRFPAIQARRFRLASSGGEGWPSGNMRPAELVFHGTSLGNSHPDVRANNTSAVLFDEDEDVLRSMFRGIAAPFRYRYDGAYAKGMLSAPPVLARTREVHVRAAHGVGLRLLPVVDAPPLDGLGVGRVRVDPGEDAGPDGVPVAPRGVLLRHPVGGRVHRIQVHERKRCRHVLAVVEMDVQRGVRNTVEEVSAPVPLVPGGDDLVEHAL